MSFDKHEQDNKELKLKYEQDIQEFKLKNENELKEIKLKNENELKEVKSKHDEDVKVLRQEISMSRTMGATAHVPQASSLKPSLNQAPEPAYTWKIANFTRKLARAVSDDVYGVLESEPFFSSHGYKMKLLVYLNQGPSGNTGYLGVYLGLVKSDQDGSLPWPFTKRCTIVLLDQQDDPGQSQNIKKTLVPNGELAFQRRRSWQRKNLGRGFASFVKHSTLSTRQYIRDHNVYIEAVIDP